MLVALNVNDFLDRAATVYPQRVAIVDDPSAAAPLGELTYSNFESRARGMALHLEAMGVGQGDRVAIVSPNAAKFMISYFGVSGWAERLGLRWVRASGVMSNATAGDRSTGPSAPSRPQSQGVNSLLPSRLEGGQSTPGHTSCALWAMGLM